MEFTSQFALINTAFNLAAKYETGGLENYQKDENSRSFSISCKAVREALKSGHKNTSNGHLHLKLRIVAAFLAKLKQNELKKDAVGTEPEDWTVENDADYFEAVTVGLPAFNRSFLFDIVKNNDLSTDFCEVICSLQPQVAGDMLSSLLQHFQVRTDARDLELLAQILEYLVHKPNAYMARTAEETSDIDRKSSDTVAQVIDQLQKYMKADESKENKFSDFVTELLRTFEHVSDQLQAEQDSVKVRIFVSMVGLVNCVLSGKMKFNSSCDFSEEYMQKCAKFFRLMKCNTQTDFEEAYFFLQKLQLDDKSWCTMPFRHFLPKHQIIDVVTSCEQLKNHFHPDFESVLLRIWKGHLAEIALKSTSDKFIFTKKDEKRTFNLPDVNQTLTLLRSGGTVLPQYECDEVVGFSNRIKNLQENVERALKVTYEHSRKRLLIQTAAAIVDLKFPHYKGYLGMLCGEPMSELTKYLEDWIGLLKRNISCISLTATQALIMEAEKLSHQSNQLQEIIKVILSAYRNLEVGAQLALLEYVVGYHDPETLFLLVTASGEFVSTLTSVFNKLANITDLDKAVSEVCVLALQSPTRTLRKILFDAVDSPGQQPLLIELLQNITPLCFHKAREEGKSKHTVANIMDDILVEIATDQKKLASFNKLLTRLLKGNSFLFGKSMLQPEEFLQTTILPRFQDPRCIDIPLHSLLEVLLTTVQRREGIEWMSDSEIYPMVLCLCDIIDEHRFLDLEMIEMSIHIKTMAILCFTPLEKFLVDLESEIEKPDEGLQWLYNSMQELHWTTVLRMQRVFTEHAHFYIIISVPLILQDVPRSLGQFLRNSKTTFSFVIENVDVLDAVLELGMVSDYSLETVLSDGDFAVFDGNSSLSEMVVAILAEKLVNSIGDEWSRASAIVQHLIRGEVLPVSVTPAARDTVPCINMTECRVLLGTSQVFWEVMMVLSNYLKDVSRTIFICKKYVGVFYALLSCEVSKINQLEKLFTLSQIFCQNCFLLSEFGPEFGDVLLVLVLDILNNHSKLCGTVVKNATNDMLLEVENQKIAMERAIRQAPEVQRETLLKKFTI